MYGVERLISELRALGYGATAVRGQQPGSTEILDFGVIEGYEVQLGRFVGRVIQLGLPAPPDFPKSVGASIHVCADPQLLEYGQVANERNIQQSALGPEWRYWSHNFQWSGERDRSAARLLAQINGIFERA